MNNREAVNTGDAEMRLDRVKSCELVKKRLRLNNNEAVNVAEGEIGLD
jgi:hypothetical protein